VYDFKIIAPITNIRTIATGSRIRELPRLKKFYGGTHWRKKGVSRIQLRTGDIRTAELHWYEAHGIGKKEMKRKRYVD
jgi:hypothetical protein